jgi:hypothetical protein
MYTVCALHICCCCCWLLLLSNAVAVSVAKLCSLPSKRTGLVCTGSVESQPACSIRSACSAATAFDAAIAYSLLLLLLLPFALLVLLLLLQLKALALMPLLLRYCHYCSFQVLLYTASLSSKLVVLQKCDITRVRIRKTAQCEHSS